MQSGVRDVCEWRFNSARVLGDVLLSDGCDRSCSSNRSMHFFVHFYPPRNPQLRLQIDQNNVHFFMHRNGYQYMKKDHRIGPLG